VTTSCDPNPCNNPPTCYASPGTCTEHPTLGPQCNYNVKSALGTPCHSEFGECDGNGMCDTCLANSQSCPSSHATLCRQGSGTCVGNKGDPERACEYETLASSSSPCPGGVCNAQGSCTGGCNNPGCETCSSTAPAMCTECKNGEDTQAGCCFDNVCLNVDGIGSQSGEFILDGMSGTKPYYKNGEKYLTFYCCSWGWAITNKPGGGSASARSNNEAENAIDTSGDWNGKTVTITKCDPCAAKICDSPPQCYTGPGTCNSCGICDYILAAQGTSCTVGNNAGSCDGLGGCGIAVIVTQSPTVTPQTPTTTPPTKSPTKSPTTSSPTATPRCEAQDIWPVTNIGITQEVACPTGTSGSHTRTCNSGGQWGSAINECVAVATCNDGKQNGDETGIDCGGSSCDSCEWCQQVICTPHGTCNELKRLCDCTGGYSGDRCETAPASLCAGIECGAHGSCDPTRGPPCQCTEGWEGDSCQLQPYGNCSNGLQDGDEKGVDCGGSAGLQCDSPQPCPGPSFHIEELSECSTSCGAGIQQVTVVCKDPNGIVQPNQVCIDANVHPISSSRTCFNQQECAAYTWEVGTYGQCTTTCGGGIQSREVRCRSSIGNIVVDNSLCDNKDKPIEIKDCNAVECEGPHWEVPLWGVCSRTCGGGIQTREIFCVDKDGIAVAETECSKDITVLRTERGCNIYPCNEYHWTTCPMYEPCTASCGGGYGMLGVQRVEVFCRDSSENVIDSSLCTDTQPSQTILGCNPQPCTDYNWMADAPWGACLDGKKLRTFHCHSPDGGNAKPNDCVTRGIPVPPDMMMCEPNTCSTYDYAPDMSRAMSANVFIFSSYFLSVILFLVFL